MPQAQWWHSEHDRVVCDLCPRECRLAEGQRGFCFVRQNVGGEMELTTYGRSTGFCIDPIEKKPLNHFLPGTAVLSFGTAGCNLGCKFCQNWSISKSKEIEALSESARPEQIARAAQETGCRSVAFTYNDPVIWAEYAIDTAIACRDRGIKSVAVTAGYISPEARRDFYRHIDAANVDLKAFTDTFYHHLTLSRLDPVLETLRWLKDESDVWFEITNLMIPGENDDVGETERLCDWVVKHLGCDVPVHFTAFHPDFRMQDRPATPPETLALAWEIAREAGIRFPYVGNVHDGRRDSTFCPRCGELLVERDWHQLGRYRLQGNLCGECGTEIAGVFDASPGRWGRRRVPVRIQSYETASEAALPVHSVGETGGSNSSRGPMAISSPAVCQIAEPEVVQISSLGAVGAVLSGSRRERLIEGERANMAKSQRNRETKSSKAEDKTRDKSTGGDGSINRDEGLDQEDTAATAVAEVDATDLGPTPESGGPEQTAGDQNQFSHEEQEFMLRFAREVVEASVRPIQTVVEEMPSMLAARPTFGVFVTIKRADMLRACRGRWGNEQPLREMLISAAQDAARSDTRFPSLQAEELPLLDIELSIMHSPRQVDPARAEELVKVGRDGLVLMHPEGRGLLLPQVPLEHGWDVHGYLEHLCLKAGLAPGRHREPAANLLAFEAAIMHKAAPIPEVNPLRWEQIEHEQLFQITQLLAQGADLAPLPPRFEEPHLEDLGMVVETVDNISAAAIGSQQSLRQLVQSVVDPFRNDKEKQHIIARVHLLWQPIPVVASDAPSQMAILRNCSIAARWGTAWALSVPRADNHDPISEVLEAIGTSRPQWEQGAMLATPQPTLTAFTTWTIDATPPENNAGASVPTRAANESVRAPARAGQFFPASAADVNAELDRFFGAVPSQERRARAVMLPHAGWRYCGDVTAATIGRVRVPDLVVILSPKHTDLGARWSLSSADRWDFPGMSVPVAKEARDLLAGRLSLFEVESAAHRMEHGVEVLVPFLHRRNPNIKILPAVLGGRGTDEDFAEAVALARELAALREEYGDNMMWVISSDLNHFGEGKENRRRDFLALDAMESGDPTNLFATVRAHGISMCGLLPAVAVMQALAIEQGEETVNTPIELMAYSNSGMTTGDSSRVVGYGGMILD